MKRWQGAAVIGAIAAAVVGQWYAASARETAPVGDASAAAPPVPDAPPPAPRPPVAGEPATAEAENSDGDGLRRVPIAPVDTSTPAWLPLAQARESGDPRTPPIQHDAPTEHPDASVLADPQAYAAHQLAQKQRLAAAYAQAAVPELARLQSDLEQGREAGVPPEELAKVAEKIRRIEQQRQAAEAAK
ncbi:MULTISPECIES: hypothetical protein [unclassified Duganella]|uniref:hypothetical protein n=1 Tax=unclassified Duganella TaxID=2636909 RepID=UPI00070041C8|nr:MULTISPECIES: hypothetical protein [unclassified Duganella]KQV61855.1 hypothetical protein ASD07_03245 [Duganella sp. Root336D2]KRB84364.1 hypothetical protein ASE26_09920 [Duganella sp. Root198D2]